MDAATAAAMEEHAPAIALLPQGRLQMELGSLLGHGAARPSLGLMWRLGLLDMLLPQQALYLKVCGCGLGVCGCGVGGGGRGSTWRGHMETMLGWGGHTPRLTCTGSHAWPPPPLPRP